MNCKTLSNHFLAYLFAALLISSKAFALENENDDFLTLDRTNDTTNWKISSTNLTKWFEYFDNTTQLTGNLPETCSEIISSNLNNLDDVDGIWVACGDPILPTDCDMHGSSSCYPEINFPNKFYNPSLRSVKIKIALLGFATLRFNVGSHFCIDYSYRKEPMSQCQCIEILPQLQWVDVEISTDESITFRTFSIQLFSRFKGDAVLVDKIEALPYLPCENPSDPCPSTASTVSTTIFPSSTPSAEIFKSVLDNDTDASLPSNYTWELPNASPKWMEYYVDYDNFLDSKNDPTTCSNLISSKFTNRQLPNVPGIWSSCRKSDTCDSNPSSCHPGIYYKTPEEHYIHSISSKFYLQNTSMIKLHAGDECWDLKFENVTTPPCKLFRIPDAGRDRWNSFFWTGQTFLPNQKTMEFRLELISQSSTDVILLDRIEVQYGKCENIDECSSQPTNPPEQTSTAGTGTTDEGTTPTNCDSSTTTDQSDLTDGPTTITGETSDKTDTTASIETTTDNDGTTTDGGETICTTTVTRTTTRRSGSSARALMNTFTFMIVFVILIVNW